MIETKIEVYLLYDKNKYEKMEFDYMNKFHLDNTLKGYFVVANERGIVPHSIICFIKNVFYRFMTTLKDNGVK